MRFIVRKPTIMVMGGSLGAVAINQFIRKILSRLTTRFNVIHLCGKNNLDPSLENTPGYKQFEYVDEDLPHLMALASLIISRAGANSIYEFLALKKPNILIPLPLSASRGDQIQNAQSFERQGFSKVLDQETLTDDILLHQFWMSMPTDEIHRQDGRMDHTRVLKGSWILSMNMQNPSYTPILIK